MNIVEAFVKAENGALITNKTYKQFNRFLKYIENGVFYEYEIVDGKAEFKYEVMHFSTAYCLSISWEEVENKYFKE